MVKTPGTSEAPNEPFCRTRPARLLHELEGGRRGVVALREMLIGSLKLGSSARLRCQSLAEHGEFSFGFRARSLRAEHGVHYNPAGNLGVTTTKPTKLKQKTKEPDGWEPSCVTHLAMGHNSLTPSERDPIQ